MDDKNGTLEQRRQSLFSNNPVNGMGTCPFKGANIAIVPMRYALDRSPYDVDPARLTPLDAGGKWARHPELVTRQYTLRQLRNGFVYVYDETDDVLHEYAYRAHNGILSALDWDDSKPDSQRHSPANWDSTHLLYPRDRTLRLAFSAHRWSWHMREVMRASPLKRNAWMRSLDLREYSRSMSVPHALPLERLKDRVVADVDPYPINHDGRFADSAHPPTVPEDADYLSAPLAADVLWRGSVEDRFSAVLIALDDPLGMLEDLGMQLSADQAALLAFQAEHEHALNIAGVVEHLCGFAGDHALMPVTVSDDEEKTRRYIADIDAYFEQFQSEDDMTEGQDSLTYGITQRPSTSIGADLQRRYGSLPDPELRKLWQARRKWRREVDLDAAMEYRRIRQDELKIVAQTIKDTRQDILTLGQHIGTDPMKLFIDTTESKSLLCLLEITADLMCNLSQDTAFSRWLLAEEEQPTTLFGLARFGFSETLKNALTEEANRLMNGVSDFNSLAGRAGEINNLLNHDKLADHPAIRALGETAQQTLNALTYLARNLGKSALQNLQLALLSVDSRLAQSKNGQKAIMLRNLAIGQVFFNPADRLQMDADFEKRLKKWQEEGKRLNNEVAQANKRPSKPLGSLERKSMLHSLTLLDARAKAHALVRPQLVDFFNNGYLRTLQENVANIVRNHSQVVQNWSHNAKNMIKEYGLNSSAITWGVAVANLYNTCVTYELASRDGELSKKDLAKVGSAAAYTGSAIMALFVETAWPGIKELETVIDSEKTKITSRSARYWAGKGGEFKNWSKLIRGFGARLVGMGGFSVVAAKLELWDLQDDMRDMKGSLDIRFMKVKIAAVKTFLGIGVLQLSAGVLALTGYGKFIPWVMHLWLAIAVAAVGVIYMFVVFGLNYLKRDIVGQWLHQCRWSRQPEAIFNSEIEEARSFLELQLSPGLFVKPTFDSRQKIFHFRGHHMERFLTGAWVQLRIPAELRGERIHVELAASKRTVGMPVKLLSGSLHYEFIEHGAVAPQQKWGEVPELALESPYYLYIPGSEIKEEESIIWQTWIPLDEGAEYLEMHIWYPDQILPASEGDKGYRYQLELVEEGTFDNNENRSVGSSIKMLPVDRLGGRGTVTPLLITK